MSTQRDDRPRPLQAAQCSLCGIALPIGLMVPDGGQACADIRWYCKDAQACTERWTANPPRHGQVAPTRRELPTSVRELPTGVRELPTGVRELPTAVRELPTAGRTLPAASREPATGSGERPAEPGASETVAAELMGGPVHDAWSVDLP